MVIEHLDLMAFNNFIKRKSVPIIQLIEHGILKSGMDWNDLKRLRDVRSFCHEILLQLVMVHAQVSGVSKPLVPRVLSCMFQRVAQTILLSFRHVDQFSPVGTLQALLEVEFLRDTLQAYATPTTDELFLLIEDTIDKSVDQQDEVYIQFKQMMKERDVQEMQDEQTKKKQKRTFGGLLKDVWHEKNAMLEDAKLATKIQLLCFKVDQAPARQDVDDEEASDDELE